MARSYSVYDVFTDRKLAGNPLAVIFDGEDLSDEAMQSIARETLRVHPHCTATLEEQLNWQRLVFELALCKKNRAPLVRATEIAGIQPRPSLRGQRRARTLRRLGNHFRRKNSCSPW